MPFGAGTGVSRSAVSTGGAIRLAASDISGKATEIARFFLEGRGGGTGDCRRPNLRHRRPIAPSSTLRRMWRQQLMTLPALCQLPDNIERGLQSTRTFDPPHQTFGHGAHLAFVRVDAETGKVNVEQYICVEDCGTIIDHVIVDGQVVGAVGPGHRQRAARGAGVRR